MLKKILGPFHFTLSILGTEVFSASLFTEDDQSLGMGGWEAIPEDVYAEGPFEGMSDDDVDAMLDAMLEARERGHDEEDYGDE